MGREIEVFGSGPSFKGSYSTSVMIPSYFQQLPQVSVPFSASLQVVFVLGAPLLPPASPAGWLSLSCRDCPCPCTQQPQRRTSALMRSCSTLQTAAKCSCRWKASSVSLCTSFSYFCKALNTASQVSEQQQPPQGRGMGKSCNYLLPELV